MGQHPHHGLFELLRRRHLPQRREHVLLDRVVGVTLEVDFPNDLVQVEGVEHAELIITALLLVGVEVVYLFFGVFVLQHGRVGEGGGRRVFLQTGGRVQQTDLVLLEHPPVDAPFRQTLFPSPDQHLGDQGVVLQHLDLLYFVHVLLHATLQVVLRVARHFLVQTVQVGSLLQQRLPSPTSPFALLTAFRRTLHVVLH